MLALTMLCAACGVDDSRSTSAGLTSSTITGAAEAADVVVVVDAMAYLPQHIEIAVGATVAWSFEDRSPHDVAFEDGPASPIQRDGVWTRTFDQPGTYEYLCTLHPSMTGTVTVVG